MADNHTPRRALNIAVALWLAVLLLGSFGQSIQGFPREAFFSLDGQPVDRCIAINDEASEEQQGEWCTPTEVLGPALPDDVEVASGDIVWSEVGFEEVGSALLQPALWFTIGIGMIALLVFGAFAAATGTVRAGIAASVSIVFLALLLFPAEFTAQVPGDLRQELVSAWQWVIAFYFGSEAAVQAFKAVRPSNAPVEGDLPSDAAAQLFRR